MSKEIITAFYTAFQQLDGDAMATHYHEHAYFSDPVFKNLTAGEAAAMWKMLIERSKGRLNIDFHSIEEGDESASCIWEAKYVFGKTGRPVQNIIKSEMTFKDNKIFLHEDHFDFWRWSRQALGITGTLLGWSPYLKGVVRKQARSSLVKFIDGNHKK